MLETGNWLVPYVGGKPFLRKPPLVNWAIAASFKFTGVRNEWTARLPSALCVLALGADDRGHERPRLDECGDGVRRGGDGDDAIRLAGEGALCGRGDRRNLRAALGDRDRVLAGVVVARRSPWLVWVVPGVLLGLASLAKGPSFHLIFFYAIALTVWASARRWRDLAASCAVRGAGLAPVHFRRVGGAVF